MGFRIGRFGAAESEGRIGDVGIGQVAVGNGGHLRSASPTPSFGRVQGIAFEFRMGLDQRRHHYGCVDLFPHIADHIQRSERAGTFRKRTGRRST